MQEKLNCIELTDGTILEKSSCGYAERTLSCWVNEKTLAECFLLFSDPEKLSEIKCYFATTHVVYKGFTDLLSILKGENEFGKMQISIRLTWREGGDHSIVEYPNEE